jgi:hypothetical protein
MESLVERMLPDALAGRAAPPLFWSPRQQVHRVRRRKAEKIDRSEDWRKRSPTCRLLFVGGTWNRDGVVVFSGIDKGLFRVSSDAAHADANATVTRRRR